MKYRKIIIASEVKEEIVDILSMLENRNVDIGFFLSYKVDTEGLNLDALGKIYIENRISSFAVVQKIYGLIYFLWIVYGFKPDIIFSGFSMMKYRVASMVFSIFHIAYFRGLLFDSSNRSGVSDRLYYGFLGRIKFLRKVLCTYYANLVFVTADISKKFVKERYAEIHVANIGPIWLKKIKKRDDELCSERKIIFLTQAFEGHGFPRQQKSQVENLLLLDGVCAKHNCRLIIRVHPRDSFSYDQIKFFSSVVFDRSSPEDFLKKISLVNSVLITPLSTLAFEVLYLGGKAIFYSSSVLDLIYKKSYQILGVNPIDISLLESVDFLFEMSSIASIFSDADEEISPMMDRMFGKKNND